MATEADNEFLDGEGFLEVVVGSQFEAGDDIVRGGFGCEEENRGTVIGLPDAADHLEAVQSGHHHVGNKNIRVDFKAMSDAALCLSFVFPDRLFEAQYIEEMIADGFADESRVLNIVLIFTLLSILVSAFGLFAMSSYYMQQEIRSVSVKKAFGADYSGVLKELVLSFMKMVGIAFVIGVPIAWFIMNRWLSGYGHRIDLHWWIFALAGLAVAVIAAISVLYQSIKTARTNPEEALKKE